MTYGQNLDIDEIGYHAESREGTGGEMSYKVWTLTDIECKDAVEGVGEFTGYLSVYGNRDEQGEVVDKGAFKRSLDHQKETGDPVPLLWNHDRDSVPIGGMSLAEDSHGLKVKGFFSLESEHARAVYAAVKAKTVKGMSIGFRTIKDAWIKGVRHLQEVALLEGSIVTWPANKQALITAVKANDKVSSALGEVKRVISDALEEKDINSAFGHVQAVAQALRDSLLKMVPEGANNAAMWDALNEVRSTCEAVMQMLYSLGSPEDAAQSLAAILGAVEGKAKEQRILEGASLRKARAALAALMVLLDEAEDSTNESGDATPPEKRHVAEVPELTAALVALKAFNDSQSRRTDHA